MSLQLFQEYRLRFVRTTQVLIETEIASSVQTRLHAALSRHPNMPRSQWVPEAFSPGVRQEGREANSLPPSTTVKTAEGQFFDSHLYLHGIHKDNFNTGLLFNL
jgi:sensor domain CHASE-containing protein